MLAFLKKILSAISSLFSGPKVTDQCDSTASDTSCNYTPLIDNAVLVPDQKPAQTVVPDQTQPVAEDPFSLLIAQERAFLGKVEGKHLDDQQMACVISKDKNALVLAGAGTGKTSTIVGKIVYILKRKYYRAGNIAAISYTSESAKELRMRVQKATGKKIHVSTFHSLALRIICSVEHQSPKIYTKEPLSLYSKMLSCELLAEPLVRDICEYMLYGYDVLRSEFSFVSYEDYDKYLKTHLPRKTLNGERVCNFGEFTIANFLAVHGIEYRYYAPTRSFLVEGRVFINYDPFDHDNLVPAYFPHDSAETPTQSYTTKLFPKRKKYQFGNSPVINLTSMQLSNGSIPHTLSQSLRQYKIQIPILSKIQLWEKISQDNTLLQRFAKLLDSVTAFMDRRNYSFNDLEQRLANHSQAEYSYSLFVKMFRHFYADYLKDKNAQDAFTFNELLFTATNYVKQGKYRSPYKFIIVDEYQDIAPSAYGFLRSLHDSANASLFAVGDDWQSIYRFNGSDISYILDFIDQWPSSVGFKIETTYRFPQNIVDICRKFVCRNPRQIVKDIRSKSPVRGQAMFVSSYSSPETALESICKVLEDLPRDSSVFFLGRFKTDWRDLSAGCATFVSDEKGNSITYLRRPDLRIRFLTAHASKGLEADFSIIINMKDEMKGFPSKIPNHPIIDLLENNSVPFPYDEERRLFYVAATRAKKKTFLLVPESRPSEFAKEILRDNPGIAAQDGQFCLICGSKYIHIAGDIDDFFICSNVKCNHTRKLLWHPPS